MTGQGLVELGSVADFVNGAAFKPSDWEEAGTPIIRIQNLTDPDKPFNRTTRLVSDRIRALPGDLLVSWSATLGVFEWAGPEEGLVNQHIFRVIPREDRVDKRYLRYVLTGALTDVARYLHGATMRHVNRKEFLSTLIPLPSLQEQQRIAAILDQAEGLRAKRRESLVQLDSLAQSIFLDMFGDPIVNPLGWSRVPLANVLDRIDSGKSPVCMDRCAEGDEWGVLKLGAVTWGTYRDSENKALPSLVAPDRALEVKQGDLLFTRKNTRELVGAAAYVYDTRSKLLLSDLIFRLRLKSATALPQFLHRLLSIPSKRREIQTLAGGSAGSMPNISKARLANALIELPPLDLQKMFVDRVEAIRHISLDSARGRLELDSLFSSLQYQAFRGAL